jgi:hypothetical protein
VCFWANDVECVWLGELCVGLCSSTGAGTITFGCRGKVLAGELVGVTRDLQMEGIRVHVASCNAVVVLETDIGA